MSATVGVSFASTVDEVLDALNSLGAQFLVLRNDNEGIGGALKRLTGRPAGTVGVLCGRAAIRGYDAHHPERVVCLLVRAPVPQGGPVQFKVVVRDRDVGDLQAYVRTWLTQPDEIVPARAQKPECVVCMVPLWFRK